jgi:hypothetical protein
MERAEYKEQPRLVFADSIDELDLWEIAQKGWCGCAQVACPDGLRYAVTFFTPLRLHQAVNSDVRQGPHWLGEIGLIIVTETTLSVMEGAIAALWKQHWFDHLRPINGTDSTTAG